MVNIVLSGHGKMGHMIEQTIGRMRSEAGDAAGICLLGASEDIAGFDRNIAAEAVCIDFTTPAAFRSNYKVLADNFKAVVVGTTGWNDIADEVFAYFEQAGTPLIYASNFSIGVNVFTAAVSRVSELLSQSGGYAPYIVEKHHCHKLDAPSGTAKTLAAAVERGMGVYPDVAAVRVGELAGTHTVGFEGLSDRITLEHEAFSRQGFADGAILAARMTEGLSGIHEFSELLLKA